MKRKLSALAQRYLAALRRHLKQGPPARPGAARALGRQAVAIGLETLDLARLHERALATLGTSGAKKESIERAGIFFTEAITPIEQTHRAALDAGARLDRLNQTLSRRTLDLSAANRSLKQGTAQRKAAQTALKKSGKDHQKRLTQSLALQKDLQRLSHRILSAHEERRKQISHDLQDDIAQTLLGINVRLLSVQKAADYNGPDLQEQISSTQRVVAMSAKNIKLFANQMGRLQAT
jgi:signal transduction histidine kinase